MTLKEAIGVHQCDIDIKTGMRMTHSDIYGRAIDLLGGLDVVAPYIPFPLDDIRKALKTDPHLNNTPIRQWDLAAGFQVFRGDPLPSLGRRNFRFFSPVILLRGGTNSPGLDE